MDSESQHTSASAKYFSRAKRAIVIIGFAAVLVLEIYISYFISGSGGSGGAKIDVGKFVCGQDLRVGDTLHVRICNKLISIFKSGNSTARVGHVTLSEKEWSELEDLFRRR
jgi:hypothetical protein